MIAVSVCTYKRPKDLARLIESFLTIETTEAIEFVVVDNDGNDPEVERLVASLAERSGRPAHYTVERQPGISAARNAAFNKARGIKAELVAMLDDDEWVTPNWLNALLATRAATGAQVVGGPVHPVFSEARRHMAKNATLWAVEQDFLHGKPFVSCTCNFLIDLKVVEPLGDEPFDEAYGLTGGGDAVFFRKLAAMDVPMAWSPDAYLHESMPDSRANLKWLRQRRYRIGNVAFRWEHDVPAKGDLPPTLKTLAACARLCVFPLVVKTRGPLLLAWLLEFDKVRGRLAAQFGSKYAEYRREPVKACR